jgi:mitotic spindle assembly checkpoint protein MAD1
LDAEVTDLMRRVASGEYNPEKERCIELANNPAAKEKTIRKVELDQLRAENEALLEEIQALEESKGLKEEDGYVPRASWERLQRENREMETGHTKRLQRLKEVRSHTRNRLIAPDFQHEVQRVPRGCLLSPRLAHQV